jgi:hypothetical protein
MEVDPSSDYRLVGSVTRSPQSNGSKTASFEIATGSSGLRLAFPFTTVYSINKCLRHQNRDPAQPHCLTKLTLPPGNCLPIKTITSDYINVPLTNILSAINLDLLQHATFKDLLSIRREN